MTQSPFASRQVRRAVGRAMAKSASRKDQARPSFGDRRLNRRSRFALWALQRRISGGVALASEAAVLAAAALYRLPVQIVREAAGEPAQLHAQAA